MKEHGKWKLVEMARPLNLMMEQEEKVEGLKESALVLTILSAGEHGAGDLGFEVLEPFKERERPREGLSEFGIPVAERKEERIQEEIERQQRYEQDPTAQTRMKLR